MEVGPHPHVQVAAHSKNVKYAGPKHLLEQGWGGGRAPGDKLGQSNQRTTLVKTQGGGSRGMQTTVE